MDEAILEAAKALDPLAFDPPKTPPRGLEGASSAVLHAEYKRRRKRAFKQAALVIKVWKASKLKNTSMLVVNLQNRREMINRGNGDVIDVADPVCVEAANTIIALTDIIKLGN